MKAAKSTLVLNDFTILSSSCTFIQIKDDISAVKSLLTDYAIDIDFNIIDSTGENNTRLIFVKVSINPEKNPGYSIFAEGVGVFSFADHAEMKEDEQNQLILYSGVSICITNLRSFIANITSYYPLGKFNFSSIDMNDLIKEKISQMNINGMKTE